MGDRVWLKMGRDPQQVTVLGVKEFGPSFLYEIEREVHGHKVQHPVPEHLIVGRVDGGDAGSFPGRSARDGKGGRDGGKSNASAFRTWTNRDGVTIKAKMLSHSDDSVRLEMENGKIHVYPLSKLSDADQQFVRSGAKTNEGANETERDSAQSPRLPGDHSRPRPFPGRRPGFGGNGSSMSQMPLTPINLGQAKLMDVDPSMGWSLRPDARTSPSVGKLQKQLKLPSSNGPRRVSLFFDQDRSMALVQTINTTMQLKNAASLLVPINLETGKVYETIELPDPNSKPVAISNDRKLLASVGNQGAFGEKRRVDVWRVLGGGSVEHVVGFEPSQSRATVISEVEFVGNDHLLVDVGMMQPIVFNATNGQPVLRLDMGHRSLGLTPRRKYMVTHKNRQLYCFDLEHGTCVASRSWPDNSVTECAFSDDGQRMALVAQTGLYLFDFSSGKLIDSFAFSRAAVTKRLTFINDRFLLLDLDSDKLILDTRLRCAVWNFSTFGGSAEVRAAGDSHVGVAINRDEGIDFSVNPLVTGPLQSVIGQLDESIWALKPGDEVAFQLDLKVYSSERDAGFRETLRERIERHFKLVRNSNKVIRVGLRGRPRAHWEGEKVERRNPVQRNRSARGGEAQVLAIELIENGKTVWVQYTPDYDIGAGQPVVNYPWIEYLHVPMYIARTPEAPFFGDSTVGAAVPQVKYFNRGE